MYAIIHNRLCRRRRGCWYPVFVRTPSLTERVAHSTRISAAGVSPVGAARRTDRLIKR